MHKFLAELVLRVGINTNGNGNNYLVFLIMVGNKFGYQSVISPKKLIMRKRITIFLIFFLRVLPFRSLSMM